MHQQQARHQVVVGERGQHLVVEPPGLVEDVQDALEAGAVEVGHQPDQLLGALARHHAAGRRWRRAGVSMRSPVALQPVGPCSGRHRHRLTRR